MHLHELADRPDRRPRRLPPGNSEYAPTQPRAAARDPQRRRRRPDRLHRAPSRPPARRSRSRSPASGTANVPADAKAVFLNVTAVNSDGRRLGHGVPVRFAAAERVERQPRARPRPGQPGRGEGRHRRQGVPVHQQGDRPRRRPPGLRARRSSPFVPTVPERVLETRAVEGQVSYSAPSRWPARPSRCKVTGFGTTKIPADAGTVLLNVTATESSPTAASSRCSRAVRRGRWPRTSTSPAIDTTNLVAAKIGDGGRVCIYTSSAPISSPTSPATSRTPHRRFLTGAWTSRPPSSPGSTRSEATVALSRRRSRSVLIIAGAGRCRRPTTPRRPTEVVVGAGRGGHDPHRARRIARRADRRPAGPPRVDARATTSPGRRSGSPTCNRPRSPSTPTYYPKADGALAESLALDDDDNFLVYAGLSALASARHDFALPSSTPSRAWRSTPTAPSSTAR